MNVNGTTVQLLISSLVLVVVSGAHAGECRIPQGDVEYVSDSARDACVREARLVLRQPEISRETIARGPTQPELPDDVWGGFDPNADLRCRYKQEDWGGESPKFYCLRSNDQGELYSKKRTENAGGQPQTVAGAVQADAQDQLQDQVGVVLTNSRGKIYKGDELKFKYFHNQPVRLANGQTEQGVPDREREVFTEAAATRFLWAVGIPADRTYPVKSVTCDGCTADPFGTQRAIARRDQRNASVLTANLAQARFETVAVERKFPAKRIEPRRGVEGNTKVGFAFSEIAQRGSRPEQQGDLEILLLASAVIGYHNDLTQQNRLACADQVVDQNGRVVEGSNKDTGECFHPVAMIQDVGSTFGNKKANPLATNPRGDYAAFSRWQVWADKGACQLSFDFARRNTVSEASRLAFVERISRVKPFVTDILRQARFSHIDTVFRAQVRQQRRLEGAALDEAVVSAWAEQVQRNIREIETATCAR